MILSNPAEALEEVNGRDGLSTQAEIFHAEPHVWPRRGQTPVDKKTRRMSTSVSLTSLSDRAQNLRRAKKLPRYRATEWPSAEPQEPTY